MKKAKMVLTVIALFTIVGAALAFKANKVNPNLLFCNTSNLCQISDYSDITGSITSVNLTRLFRFGIIGDPCTETNCTVNPTTAFFNQ